MRVVVLLCVLGIILVVRYIFFLPTTTFQVGQKVVLTHTFLQEPKVSTNSQTFSEQGVLVKVPIYPKFSYGDTVTVEGSLEQITVGQNTSRQKKEFTLVFPYIQKVNKSYTPVLTVVAEVRKHIIMTFRKYLGRNEAGLLLGIVFGIKDQLDDTFYADLQKVGVLHVIAASGMNVTMVSEFVVALLLYSMRRRFALLVTLLVLAIYVVLSGADPSIIRAAIMGGIVFSAQISGRQNYSFLTLLITGFFMVMIYPLLIWNVGFQLSFAATAGIVYLKPLLDRLSKKFEADKSGERETLTTTLKAFFFQDLTTSIAAQIATLPILLSVFGNYSLISIIVNILILWMIPFLMILGGIASLFSFIHPLLAVAFLYLSMPLLLLFEAVVRVAATLSVSLSVDFLPDALIVGYYLLLLWIVLVAKQFRKS